MISFRKWVKIHNFGEMGKTFKQREDKLAASPEYNQEPGHQDLICPYISQAETPSLRSAPFRSVQ